jgi:hypothetical protein
MTIEVWSKVVVCSMKFGWCRGENLVCLELVGCKWCRLGRDLGL